jgi:hypothetical protein
MWYARIGDDDRVEATPRARAHCAACGGEVAAKCGAIVTPHWAHVAREDCDDWSEVGTAWHRGWQECVEPSQREVVMGWHRADLVTPLGYVIELQHSSISPDQIAAREAFYGPRMIWVFDATDAFADDRLNLRQRDGYVSFRWKHPRKTIGACVRRVYLDLGDGSVLRVRRVHTQAPCGGWGERGAKADLQRWIASGFRVEPANATRSGRG